MRAERKRGGGKRVPRRGERGAAATEYVLVCALLIIIVGYAVPYAMQLFRYAYQVIAAVVCSPFPAAL